MEEFNKKVIASFELTLVIVSFFSIPYFFKISDPLFEELEAEYDARDLLMQGEVQKLIDSGELEGREFIGGGYISKFTGF